MTTELKNILVFKTNIQTVTQMLCIKSILDDNSNIHEWSLDQQDIDCVLRVVSPQLTSEDVIALVSKHGFQCSELD